MEKELDLLQIIYIIRKRLVLIILLPLLAAAASAAFSIYIMKPVYEASTTLIVGKKAENLDTQQAMQMLNTSVLELNQQLAKTYGVIARSHTVEQKVIDNLKLNIDPEEFDKKITVNSVDNTEVIEIAVKDQDPVMAAQIANVMAQEFSNSVIEIKKVDVVSLLDRAVAPDNPISPNKQLNTIIGFVLGLMIAMGIALLLEFLDRTFKTSRDVEQVLDLPVLGEIIHYKFEKKTK